MTNSVSRLGPNLLFYPQSRPPSRCQTLSFYEGERMAGRACLVGELFKNTEHARTCAAADATWETVIFFCCKGFAPCRLADARAEVLRSSFALPAFFLFELFFLA